MPHVPRAMCLQCKCEMTCSTTGLVIEATVQVKEQDVPYYKVSTDAFKCGSCGAEVALTSRATDVVHTREAVYNDLDAGVQVRLV